MAIGQACLTEKVSAEMKPGEHVNRRGGNDDRRGSGSQSKERQRQAGRSLDG